MSMLFPKNGGRKLVHEGRGGSGILILEIGFGPLIADFGSIWSYQKARKFRHAQKTSKVRTLYFVF